MSKRNIASFLKGRIFFYGILLIAAAAILTYLFLREKPVEYYDRTGYYLGTYVTVRVGSKTISPVVLADAAMKEIARIDEKFGSRGSGTIARLNATGQADDLDQETVFLIKSALEVAENTGGAFDPTLFTLTTLWGFDDADSEKRVPLDSEIASALAKTGYRRVELDENEMAVRLPEGLTLDLGGIAKGYAVDLAIARIKSLDPQATGFIDAGGDIGVIGPKYGDRPWIVGIRDPRGKSVQDVIEYIYLYDGAVATSGDYERFFIVDGIRYHHILDPKTGSPSRSGAISATVINKSAMLADAYATAAFVMGKDPGITFLPRYGTLVFLVMEDRSTFKSPGFEVYQQK